MTNSGKLFADELTEWIIEEGLFNHNSRCPYTISMHQMYLRLLFYLMLMIVSTGIQMKILEFFFGYLGKDIPCELLGMHIVSCQK